MPQLLSDPKAVQAWQVLEVQDTKGALMTFFITCLISPSLCVNYDIVSWMKLSH
jgi:hypothetical protein